MDTIRRQSLRKSRSTEEQVIGVLKEAEAGMATGDLVRKHGISQQTFYRWKAKHGGLDVSAARRLTQLEGENRRLKKIVADQVLVEAVKSALRKEG